MGKPKLSPEKAAQVVKLRAKKYTLSDIAKEVGISSSTVWHVLDQNAPPDKPK